MTCRSSCGCCCWWCWCCCRSTFVFQQFQHLNWRISPRCKSLQNKKNLRDDTRVFLFRFSFLSFSLFPTPHTQRICSNYESLSSFSAQRHEPTCFVGDFSRLSVPRCLLHKTFMHETRRYCFKMLRFRQPQPASPKDAMRALHLRRAAYFLLMWGCLISWPETHWTRFRKVEFIEDRNVCRICQLRYDSQTSKHSMRPNDYNIIVGRTMSHPPSLYLSLSLHCD